MAGQAKLYHYTFKCTIICVPFSPAKLLFCHCGVKWVVALCLLMLSVKPPQSCDPRATAAPNSLQLSFQRTSPHDIVISIIFEVGNKPERAFVWSPLSITKRNVLFWLDIVYYIIIFIIICQNYLDVVEPILCIFLFIVQYVQLSVMQQCHLLCEPCNCGSSSCVVLFPLLSEPTSLYCWFSSVGTSYIYFLI